MQITFLGHAGFIVEHRGTRLLIDPWFHPAFLESWFPYPDNRSLLDEVLDTTFDALYVSHTHDDHFDRTVLSQLPKNLPVLCAKFRSRQLLNDFRELGFTDIHPLAADESIPLGDGLAATMILDRSHKEDSALLVDIDGFTFLNLNDCHPKLSELPEGVDLVAAQFSGAMWYPNCYDYGPDQMADKVAEVRGGLMTTLVRTIGRLDPQTYIPCAGPPLFLDPQLAEFNRRAETIFPIWDDVAAAFAHELPDVNVLELVPGDRFTVTDGAPVIQTRGDPDSTDLEHYRERRRSEWQAHGERPSKPVETAELEAYFENLIRRNRTLLQDYTRDIRIDADDSAWIIRVRTHRPSDEPAADGEPDTDDLPTVEAIDPADDAIASSATYSFALPMGVLRSIVDGDATWEDALLSLRVRLSRTPDLFDATLMGLLRYGTTPAVTTQLRRDSTTSDETIERDGFVMQRFCPHAGEDLNEATVVDGVLECPRHHWAWNLETGVCIRGGTYPLKVSPAESST